MAKTIMLKTADGGMIRKEAVASEAITPGHLVEFGGSEELQKHSTAQGTARKAFALENDLVGGGIDDAYEEGDTVQYGVFRSGEEVQARLAYGENVSKGDPLVSDGSGALEAVGGTAPARVVAFALEALNNNEGGEALIAVEVA